MAALNDLFKPIRFDTDSNSLKETKQFEHGH